MNKSGYSLICLLLASTHSTSLLAEESRLDDYAGMQLAWVFLPSTPTPKDTTVTTKPKPATQAPVVAPTQDAVTKPAPPPPTPPVQPAEVKPVQAPVVTPVPKPVQAPVAVPAKRPVVSPAHPPEAAKARAVEWVIGLGMDVGGEELGKVYYTDGSSASVKANNGVALNLGAIVSNGKHSDFSTQFTLGYKIGGPRGAANGDVTWSAIPLEIIEYYRANRLRMGLGINYQIRPQLSVNLPATSYINKYKNAAGIIAQIGWAPPTGHYSVDLRYTSIKYQLSDVLDAPTVDGSVIGLYTSYRF